MKRKIRLTEGDLRRIVKKTINEIANDEQPNENDKNVYEYYKQLYHHQIECGSYLDMILDSDNKLSDQVYFTIQSIDNQIVDLFSQIGQMLETAYPRIRDCEDYD